jgi:hypothetical protein
MRFLVRELSRVGEPLNEVAELGPVGAEKFLNESGIGRLATQSEFDQMVALLQEEVVPAFNSVEAVLSKGEVPSPEDAEDVIDGFVDLFKSVRALSQVDVKSPDVSAVGDQLLDYLIVRYLSIYQRDLYSILSLTGVIEEHPEAPLTLDLSSVGDLVTELNTIVGETVGWGAADGRFDPYILLFFLHELFEAEGLRTSFRYPDRNLLKNATGGTLTIEDSSQGSSDASGEPLFDVSDLGGLVLATNHPSQLLEVTFFEGSRIEKRARMQT